MTKIDFVSETEFNERISICKKCLNFSNNVCKVCHCYVDSKATVKFSKCPEGKW